MQLTLTFFLGGASLAGSNVPHHAHHVAFYQVSVEILTQRWASGGKFLTLPQSLLVTPEDAELRPGECLARRQSGVESQDLDSESCGSMVFLPSQSWSMCGEPSQSHQSSSCHGILSQHPLLGMALGGDH